MAWIECQTVRTSAIPTCVGTRGAGPNGKEKHMSQQKKQVVLGHVYSVAVGGSYLPVRVDKSLGHGRYEGTTVRPDGPGGTVKFSTDRVRGDGVPEAQWRAKRATAPEAALEGAAAAASKVLGVPVGVVKPGAGQAVHVAPGRKKSARADRPVKERKTSGLDAAATVLAEAGAPLDSKTIVERMLAKGLWKTAGKTPAATIYAAMIREIAAKGADSRFRKTDRGTFALSK
jgi:hypothetical protein